MLAASCTVELEGGTQIVQKLFLFFANVFPGLTDAEPAALINFGDFETTPRARGPFDLTRIARQFGRVAISLECPRSHYLSTLLLDLTQIEKFSPRVKTGLLLKLATRCNERILVLVKFTFRNCPRTFVFLGPERSSRMHQKDLQFIHQFAKHHETRTAFRHPLSLRTEEHI
jgi:hypothetical protein